MSKRPRVENDGEDDAVMDLAKKQYRMDLEAAIDLFYEFRTNLLADESDDTVLAQSSNAKSVLKLAEGIRMRRLDVKSKKGP